MLSIEISFARYFSLYRYRDSLSLFLSITEYYNSKNRIKFREFINPMFKKNEENADR